MALNLSLFPALFGEANKKTTPKKKVL